MLKLMPLHSKGTFRLALSASVFWAGITNLKSFRAILRLVLRTPPYSEVASKDPRFAIKCLSPGYLLQDLTATERTSCFLHHYKRLLAVLPDPLLRQALSGAVKLHQFSEGADSIVLIMGLSGPCDNEGEMSLYLLVNGEAAFILSFTIVPGWVVNSAAVDVLLVSRIQGAKGRLGEVQLATKTLHDVGPAPLLVAALQGIADAFGVKQMAGVPATRQSSYSNELSAFFESAYDDFYSALGIEKNSAGFYISALPLVHKPLSSIKHGHKLRTREKQAFKSQVAAQVCRSIQEAKTATIEFSPRTGHTDNSLFA